MIHKFGLQKLPTDTRDFSLGGVFGFIDIKEVPETDWEVCSPLKIKDQKDTDYCSSYAVTSVSEDQEGVELLPEYQFFATKQITGNPEEWGADLRSACKSACSGSLPVQGFEFMQEQPREYILDPKNWPSHAEEVARIHKKSTYFSVTGRYDTFDNIRCALWQHRDDKSTIVTGAFWRNSWIYVENGIIIGEDGDGFGHAFKLFGQKVINGEIYIKAQLSGGTEIGDKGIYYFSRELCNKEIGKYGLFMFKDMDRKEAEFYLEQPYTLNTPWYIKIMYLISNIFKK